MMVEERQCLTPYVRGDGHFKVKAQNIHETRQESFLLEVFSSGLLNGCGLVGEEPEVIVGHALGQEPTRS